MSVSRTPSPKNQSNPTNPSAEVDAESWLSLENDGTETEMQTISNSSAASAQSSEVEVKSTSNDSSTVPVSQDTQNAATSVPTPSSTAVPAVKTANTDNEEEDTLGQASRPLLESEDQGNEEDCDDGYEDENGNEVSDTSRVRFRGKDEDEEEKENTAYSNTVIGNLTSKFSNILSTLVGGSSASNSSITSSLYNNSNSNGYSSSLPTGIASTLAKHSAAAVANQPKPILPDLVVWKGKFEFVHVICHSKKEGIELARAIAQHLPSLKRGPWVYHAGERDRRGNVMGEQYPTDQEISFFRLKDTAYESLRRLQPRLGLPATMELMTYPEKTGTDAFTQQTRSTFGKTNGI